MKIIHDKDRMTGQLLAWYDEHKRILPWRDDPSPYAVWVSEIMLQQTRVEAVKPYFRRFMQALPTLADLAVCDDDVLAKLCEGLGYYNRVRNMKKCAIQCVEHYHGTLPTDYDLLLQLPGIGAYTAGAIASIAYRIKVPAVDGNVLRVFSRVLAQTDDIMKEATKKKFQNIILDYIPDRCDAFNQALMEIGAMICIPNGAPLCHQCPLASECIAYQTGMQQQLPIKQPKKKRTIEHHSVIILRYQNLVHLIQRPSTGLLANLYQFDFLPNAVDEEMAITYAQSFGTVDSIVPMSNAKHIFTHKEWRMTGWMINLIERTDGTGIWATQEELCHTYALPSAIRVYKDACLMALEGA